MTLALVLLFVASALLRTVCALSFGERSIFYDELLHWKTGQSLAQTGKIALRGLNLSYSEVLYSVVIALCNLLFSDGQAAYTAALVANCILISAAVFPIYIMARRIIGERKKAFFLCAVISCLAELSVSMRIFQESLYFPLLMGFFCLFTLLVTGEKPPTVPKMVGLSAYTLLVTSCKQMGLGMVAGMACYFVYVLVTEREHRRQNLMNAVAYLGSFIAFWLSYNRIYFLLNQSRGATSSGGALSLLFQNLSDLSVYLQAFVMALYYLAGIILLMGIFVVLLPWAMWRRLLPQEKKLLILTAGAILATVGMLCFTVALSESESQGIRLHFRYLWYMMVPFLALFFALYPRLGDRRPPARFFALGGVFMALMTFCFLLPIGAGTDCPSLELLLKLAQAGGVEIVRAAAVTAAILGGYLLFVKKAKALYLWVCLALVANGLIGSAFQYATMAGYREKFASRDAAARQINDYLMGEVTPGNENILLVAPGKVGLALEECWLQLPYYFCTSANLGVDEKGNLAPELTQLQGLNDTFTTVRVSEWDYIVSKEELDISGYDLALRNESGYVYKENGAPKRLRGKIQEKDIYEDRWVGEEASLEIWMPTDAREMVLTFQADTMHFDRLSVSCVDGAGREQEIVVTGQEETYSLTLTRTSPDQDFRVTFLPEHTFVPAEELEGSLDTRSLSFRILEAETDYAPEEESGGWEPMAGQEDTQ